MLYQLSISNERSAQKKVTLKYDVNTFDLITTKIDALTRKVDKISKMQLVLFLQMCPVIFVVMLVIHLQSVKEFQFTGTIDGARQLCLEFQ